MRINPQIQPVLERAFVTRDLGELSQLLGFDSARIPVTVMPEVVPRVWTRGARGTLVCYEISTEEPLQRADLARIARALRAHNYAQLQLYLFASSGSSDIVIATFGVGEHLSTLSLRAAGVHAADLETLHELIAQDGEKGSALAARHARALDRSRVTQRFFLEFAAQRSRVAQAWSGLAVQARRDREQLALLLLSRLMFLYFLQHRGYLADDDRYLVRRLHSWRRRSTFYRGALRPLFFFVLNRPPERRPPAARAFGQLPYLNGGLFEKHSLERRHTGIDLADAALRSVFDDLLERYRFTAPESSDAGVEGVQDVGVDPEMLGRVFEGLMATRVRETSGTFYTPAATVDRLVCDTLIAHLDPHTGAAAAAALVRAGDSSQLDAYQRAATARLLRETKVLDPACGSGAFLLGSLARIAHARAALDSEEEVSVRRDTVARSLFGVDLQGDAALLCALRLWLALVPAGAQSNVQPLPNLDRHIRQGDSLIDPFDLRAAAPTSAVRRSVRELAPASQAYVSSAPEQRSALRRSLAAAEQRLARAWIDAHQQRIRYQAAELTAISGQTDLFGVLTSDARAARSALRVTRQRAAELTRLANGINHKGEHPFFSFGVHFPHVALGGFDIVLCNPPWVRSHNWPRTITHMIRQRFQVCRNSSWPSSHDTTASAGGNQIDLALLFLERAIELLAPGGVIGIILPAKFMRSLSGASARRLLLEQTDIVSIEDHSLDQRSIFAADAFAALIVARKRMPESDARQQAVEITCVQRHARPMLFQSAQRDLPLVPGDARAPWLLVPPDVRRALEQMRTASPLSAHAGLRVQRGLVTGRNDVLVLIRAQTKLGDLTEIRSLGFDAASQRAAYEGVVESAAVRPLVRGCDISAWSYQRTSSLLCRPADRSARLSRLEQYLARHQLDLAAPPKVSVTGTIVAWHDLASTLKAVVVPAGIVALNTVYFIALEDDLAHLLCGYFNSLPLRAFARAIAERAKDAHFRFFAWTVGLLPLPANWRCHEAERMRELSHSAHVAKGLDASAQAELDQMVARAYGLSRPHMRALSCFDEWLRAT